MKFALRVLLLALFCVVIAVSAVSLLAGSGWLRKLAATGSQQAGASSGEDSQAETLPDPNAPGTSSRVSLTGVPFDYEIFGVMLTYTGKVRDTSSLAEVREAVRGRGRRALADLRVQYDRLRVSPSPTFNEALTAMRMQRELAFACMFEGKFAEASSWLQQALALSQTRGMPSETPRVFHALLGLVALRQGEIENCLECVGPSSCIFPLEPGAVHRQQAGSREAVKQFTAYLEDAPGDLRARWLLNLAYMTLGEYPRQVPASYLIPLDRFRSRIDVGRFENVATAAGLTVRGPRQAGGSIFDDFNNDGWPDLLVTSIDTEEGASLFMNNGHGGFEDRSSWANLGDQMFVLNVAHADFDNDGNIDIFMMRGAWEKSARPSLLRNKGGGVFEDVTIAAGMAEPISTESAAWGDYDNDGKVDLYVCGEYTGKTPDPHGHARLYHNLGDGRFENVAMKAGLINDHWSKGCAWGDYDRDGWLDLLVTNLDGSCRLFHNEQNGRFRDAATETGFAQNRVGKPFACWFWDYDNDGWLDMFINDYDCTLAETVADYMGLKPAHQSHPHLFRNLEGKRFQDVSEEVGLVHPISAMGVNFGDLDNDGFLDIYFGTGWMSFDGLVPNVLLKNVAGRSFEDVTDSSRTGHLQKGHGISWADYDGDGDLDLFVELGGGYPSDAGYNALFQNPGHGKHWLKVKLVGVTSNRSALGARIEAQVNKPDGGSASIVRVVGNNGSFGGNPFTQHFGLGDGKTVSKLVVTWPASHTTQTFTDLPADRSIVITEGVDKYMTLDQKPASPEKP